MGRKGRQREIENWQMGGFYDNQGRQQGLWRLNYENFWDLAQIVYAGIYESGIQTQKWDTVLNNNKIGGGCYDYKGQKKGKWTELHQNFFKCNHSHCDATYVGQYLEGRKQGFWQSFFSNKMIGGGIYNDDGQKNGFWVELSDYLNDLNQIIYMGTYNDGLPIGIWEVLLIYDKKHTQIGGGAYNDEGKKNGRWVDLCRDWLNGNKEITLVGEYKNGKKIGLWNTFNWYNQSIGGGEFEDGIKKGQWVELHDNWHQKWPQISYKGIYQNGKKNGRWDTYDNYNAKEKLMLNSYYYLSGGGQFKGGIKNGNWIDVHDEWIPNWREITYHGEYCMGKKLGTWKTFEQQDRLIGGGAFNENGAKNGQWIDADERWNFYSEVIYEGEYRNNKKIGEWKKIDILNGKNSSLDCEYYNEDGPLIESKL
ncbi:unnamed protein product (macronuclear) [Paramecium tetraurelia]|uniref:MORN repeat protein n=1 Tax=Paramecium tetraurelia TaxID=5888 RepID=A0BHU1_PARTE|nr:uncharacterized protein GSPATT00029144001 [Paramecium tetraurelia]CAK58108.1 unnamed protein product [Paramecium tetraurelia]|eukprot:XP_001425506.1 hypothetical protein (macronuclear) [Paramecium tetraurelia strain d4-2]